MSTRPVTVRALAFLHDVRRSRNESPFVELDVPAEGTSVLEIAQRLELPLDLVNGAFVNGALFAGDADVRPGDRVALMPMGTPAFHPAFFGSRSAR